MSEAAEAATPVHPLPKVPDPAELLEQVQAKMEASAPSDVDPDPSDDPKAQESMDFQFEWIHPRTKKAAVTGTFTNRILTPREHLQVGVLAAGLVVNTPWDALDHESRSLARVIAHLTISITKAPIGLKLTALDSRAIYALYDKVMEHEEFFRGPPQAEKDSQG